MLAGETLTRHQVAEVLEEDPRITVVDSFVRGQVDRLLIDPDRAADFEVEPAQHPGLASARSTHPKPYAPAAALLRWDQPR